MLSGVRSHAKSYTRLNIEVGKTHIVGSEAQDGCV